MDKMTPEQRSRTMSHIKGKDTKIEVILRKALWKRGYRYRKNYQALPGSPDIAITKYKIAIFCDSKFFHGYNWEVKKQRLGTNKEYWVNKIERNMARDRDADLRLIAMEWVPVRSNISVAELARRLGTSPQNFNSKMKRESFTISDLESIAGVLGCSFERSFILPDGDKV